MQICNGPNACQASCLSCSANNVCQNCLSPEILSRSNNMCLGANSCGLSQTFNYQQQKCTACNINNCVSCQFQSNRLY